MCCSIRNDILSRNWYCILTHRITTNSTVMPRCAHCVEKADLFVTHPSSFCLSSCSSFVFASSSLPPPRHLTHFSTHITVSFKVTFERRRRVDQRRRSLRSDRCSRTRWIRLTHCTNESVWCAVVLRLSQCHFRGCQDESIRCFDLRVCPWSIIHNNNNK